MKFMKSQDIRRMWLDFFASKGHHVEPGSSLIPKNDPTLLWINAGVAALKKYFDGSEIPPSRRITNAQKCIRTNDIENVGDATHLTFFVKVRQILYCRLKNDYLASVEKCMSFKTVVSKE